MLTKQNIFDRVVTHFKTQKVCAYDGERELCMYRTPDGLKCAVGAIITDKEYSPKMDEIGNVEELLDYGLLPKRLLPFVSFYDDKPKLLNRLQRVHDLTAKYEPQQLLSPKVAKALRSIASDFNLDSSKVDW